MKTSVQTLVVSGVVAMLVTLLPPTAGSAARVVRAQDPSCNVAQDYPSAQTPLAGSTPVLFVHGMYSYPGIWDEDEHQSIPKQVAAMPGFTAWLFNYREVALNWVTDPKIGPALATAIECLARAAGNPVIVVGHSMGGLAAQYAASQIGSDQQYVASHVAEVITIGTPFNGSVAESLIEDDISDALGAVATVGNVISAGEGDELVAEILGYRSACAGMLQQAPDEENPCWLLAVGPTPVGQALLYNSPQLKALPPWPAALPVFATAGDMSGTVTIGGITAVVDHVGDVPVSTDSATAHSPAGPALVVQCTNVNFNDIGEYWDQPCFHHNLPKNPQIVTAVIAEIRGAASPRWVYAGGYGWPVVGPDGRLWYGGQDSASLVSLDPATDKFEKHPVTARSSAGRPVRASGTVAFDGAGHAWLQGSDASSAYPGDGHRFLVRYALATGAADPFPAPHECSDFQTGASYLYGESDGSVWLECVVSVGGAVDLFRITPDGTTAPVPLPSSLKLVNKLASGAGGTVWAIAIMDAGFGLAKLDAHGLVTFYPDTLTLRHTGIVGNGTGTLIGIGKCGNPPGDVCYGSVGADGSFTRLGKVPALTQSGDLGMDQHGTVWCIVGVTNNSADPQYVMQLSPTGYTHLHRFHLSLNGIPKYFHPDGPPAITPDGVVWSATSTTDLSGAFLRAGPFPEN